MKIIGLTGKAGAGKDTVAQIALEWCEENDIDAERAAFADPLKVSAARALGFQGASALGSPEEIAECVAFCNALKQDGVGVRVDLYHPAYTGPDPQPPEYEPLAKITGRQYLQFYGTEAHRDVFDREFWVNATMEPLDVRFRELRAPDVVFITDCRFNNEAAAVNERNGEVWEVVRPGVAEVAAHVSEAGLPDGAIEFQIRNEGDLSDLRSLVRSVCESNLEVVK